MKKLIYLSAAFLLSLAIVAGCKKGHIEHPLQLVASQTTVKYNQYDTLTLIGATVHDSVTFSVSPSNPGDSDTYYSYFRMANNKRGFTFFKPGTYTVSASSNGGPPASVVITVLNEDFNPPPTNTPPPPPPPSEPYTHIPLVGDLVITPTYYKLYNSDSTAFILSIKSADNYSCANSVMDYTLSQTSNNFVINIHDVLQPPSSQCVTPGRQLLSRIQFFPQPAYPITLGASYPLTITVGSTTYTGSIVFAQTYMDITWNYTSGVTFTSKHITL